MRYTIKDDRMLYSDKFSRVCYVDVPGELAISINCNTQLTSFYIDQKNVF